MKFSKVNNYKTAVTGKGNTSSRGKASSGNGNVADGKTGILYRDPAKDGRSVESDIGRHIDRQTRSAQRLYKLVNPPEKGKKNSVALRIATAFDDAFSKTDLRNGTLRAEKVYRKLLSNWEDGGLSASPDQIEETVNQYLRKSLYQTSRENVIKMLSFASEGKRWESLVTDEKDSINSLLDNLQKDYQYDSVRKHVVKSIEHQNIVIQPNEAGILEPAVIPLASSRNTSEKEALRRFLSDYATLDESKRHDLRLRLRRLVDLYFYGTGEVLVDDFDEWADHAAHRGRKEPFSEVAISLAEKNQKDQIKAVRQFYRQENLQRYRVSLLETEASPELYFQESDTNRFWIHHIENSVERIYRNFRSLDDYRLSVGYLSEKVWKGMLNYLCGKYIATGKAVWHFAMGEDLEDPGRSISLGQYMKDPSVGLTSFDYEQIKAEELLQRNTAVYVAFAANHLSSATTDLTVLEGEKDKEDFLLLKRDDLERAQRPNLRRNILQFFGGESTWQDFSFEQYYQDYAVNQGKDYDDLSFLEDLKSIIYALRNESFHFDTRRRNPGNWNQKLIAAMFAHDCKTASKQQKEKFYSNNLPMFYGENDLLSILKVLYEKQTTRASQVPSFNKVIVRRNFPDYIRDNLKWNIAFTGDDGIAKKEKFDSSLYYLLKEVYYNLFLQGKGANGKYDVKDAFVKWCCNPENGTTNEKAFKNFSDRIMEIVSNNNASLPEICQRIMTDYNLYNNKTRKVKSDYVKEKLPDSYDHFKMLLFKGLREVFAAYICKEFDMLKNPVYREKPDVEAFLPAYEAPTYTSLIGRMQDNAELQKWYVLGRLLNPRQANLLVGVLRQYIQYTGQIRRRAEETRNSIGTQIAPKAFKTYANIIDVCIQLAGMTTNCLEDYFDDKDAYARYVGNYLDFEGRYPGISESAQLERFCNDAAEDENKRVNDHESSVSLDEEGSEELGRLGVFYDAENPILNRNILLAKIYGTEAVLANIEKGRKISKADIQAFYSQRKKIGNYRLTGKCDTEEQQRALKQYQEIKNRVEFRDLVEYEEIIDELQAQMIDWCFLRERDLMYFQLGFHYTNLHNDSPKPGLYCTVTHEDREINGAVLYQVAAMYINGLPIYAVEKGKIKRKSDSMPASKKIGAFLSYADACLEQNTNDAHGGLPKDSEAFYYSGMELFENIQEHDNIIALRNYIEHFHYYARQDRSIMDLYGEIFDRFFTYDMKYQKNVGNNLYNILMRHFVRPVFSFSSTTKEVGTKGHTEKKNRAAIFLKEEAGLYSEQMTYKLPSVQKTQKRTGFNYSEADDVNKVLLDARSRDFLEGVATLLYYPDDPGKVVGEKKRVKRDNKNNSHAGSRRDSESKKYSGNNKYNNTGTRQRTWGNQNNSREKDKTSNYQTSSSSFGTSLGDLLKGFKFDD